MGCDGEGRKLARAPDCLCALRRSRLGGHLTTVGAPHLDFRSELSSSAHAMLQKYGMSRPDYLIPSEKNPRVGVDRDAVGNLIGAAAHQTKDFSSTVRLTGRPAT
jgi:hypothetical protein